jgi:hypothetical protein
MRYLSQSHMEESWCMAARRRDVTGRWMMGSCFAQVNFHVRKGVDGTHVICPQRRMWTCKYQLPSNKGSSSEAKRVAKEKIVSSKAEVMFAYSSIASS